MNSKNYLFVPFSGNYELEKIRLYIFDKHIVQTYISTNIFYIKAPNDTHDEDLTGFVELNPTEIRINFEGNKNRWPQLLHIAEYILEFFPSKIIDDQAKEVSKNEWLLVTKEILNLS